jgi:hypothetical protein
MPRRRACSPACALHPLTRVLLPAALPRCPCGAASAASSATRSPSSPAAATCLAAAPARASCRRWRAACCATPTSPRESSSARCGLAPCAGAAGAWPGAPAGLQGSLLPGCIGRARLGHRPRPPAAAAVTHTHPPTLCPLPRPCHLPRWTTRSRRCPLGCWASSAQTSRPQRCRSASTTRRACTRCACCCCCRCCSGLGLALVPLVLVELVELGLLCVPALHAALRCDLPRCKQPWRCLLAEAPCPPPCPLCPAAAAARRVGRLAVARPHVHAQRAAADQAAELPERQPVEPHAAGPARAAHRDAAPARVPRAQVYPAGQAQRQGAPAWRWWCVCVAQLGWLARLDVWRWRWAAVCGAKAGRLWSF